MNEKPPCPLDAFKEAYLEGEVARLETELKALRASEPVKRAVEAEYRNELLLKEHKKQRIVAAEELRYWRELENNHLRAELADRHSEFEGLVAVAITDNCPCCREPWVYGMGLATDCAAWAGNGGPCEGGTAMACCECLCGEDVEAGIV